MQSWLDYVQCIKKERMGAIVEQCPYAVTDDTSEATTEY